MDAFPSELLGKPEGDGWETWIVSRYGNCFTALHLLKLGQVPGTKDRLGLKIDLFKPLSLSPAGGLPRPLRCLLVSGRYLPVAWAWGVCSTRSPRPIPACQPCRPVTAAGPALVLFSAQPVPVASASSPALPGRVRNPCFLEMKPPASQTPPHECPPASQAGPVLPASVPCQPPAPAPLTGLCGCRQPECRASTRTFPLPSAGLLGPQAGPVVLCSLPWSAQEQTGEAHGLAGRAENHRGPSRPPETTGDCSRQLSWFQSLTEALKRPFLCSVYHLSLWVQ